MATKTRVHSDLPPGVEQEGTSYFRIVKYTAEDDSVYEKKRPVALTLEEAQDRRWDWYHPELGWILEGYKLAQDRDIKSIMADQSTGGQLPEDDE